MYNNYWVILRKALPSGQEWFLRWYWDESHIVDNDHYHDDGIMYDMAILMTMTMLVTMVTIIGMTMIWQSWRQWWCWWQSLGRQWYGNHDDDDDAGDNGDNHWDEWELIWLWLDQVCSSCSLPTLMASHTVCEFFISLNCTALQINAM